MNFKALENTNRLLIEADLKPLQGTRFQPTGFPDLGAATYQLPNANRTEMVLLESAQSVANRLENTIWDEAAQDVIEPLRGISYVVVKQDGEVLTNSLLEAHRINSFYLLEGKDKSFVDDLKSELDALDKKGAIDPHKLSLTLAKYDINSLLHGVFLEKIGGRFRLARALSGFIEAYNVRPVQFGGVKLDRVDPTKAEAKKGKKGKGNILYARTEYTAEAITAFFSLDLAQLRNYRLGDDATDLLIAIALYKIRSFLEDGLRLRTACDLECTDIRVTRPEKFALPKRDELATLLPKLVKAARPLFNDQPVTVVEYQEA
jgi:CRISPR-associated protein Csb1